MTETGTEKKLIHIEAAIYALKALQSELTAGVVPKPEVYDIILTNAADLHELGTGKPTQNAGAALGSISTARKSEAARLNGAKGGRPRKDGLSRNDFAGLSDQLNDIAMFSNLFFWGRMFKKGEVASVSCDSVTGKLSMELVTDDGVEDDVALPLNQIHRLRVLDRDTGEYRPFVWDKKPA